MPFPLVYNPIPLPPSSPGQRAERQILLALHLHVHFDRPLPRRSGDVEQFGANG